MNSSLNHVYRIVWNATLGLWQVASEATRGRGKTGSSQQARKARRALAAASALALVSPAAWAVLPTGGVVVAGQASIQQAGNALNIVQGSDKAAIDWQSFSIGQGNTVNFQQLSSSSVALNRVLGNDVSVIQGAINANGQVFLVNQNGVLFTPTAQVNVGGIVASTQNISTDDFMAGRYQFSGNSTATVENQGSIKAADGGVVALIAAKVINTGSIEALKGTVGLAAGNTVLLDLGGPVKIQVTEGALNAAIEQSGGIRADGGTVYLTAKAAGNLAASVINHTGVTKALSMAALTGEAGEVAQATGSIALSADLVNQAGTLDVSGLINNGRGGQIDVLAGQYTDSGTTLADGSQQGGSIDVRAKNITQTSSAVVSASSSEGEGGRVELIGDLGHGIGAFSGKIYATGRRRGGFVDTSGAKLILNDSLRVDTSSAEGEFGTWLIDPIDFTIAASGGDLTGTALGQILTVTNLIIQTDAQQPCIVANTCGSGKEGNGDIFVNDNVTWASPGKLTLRAHRHIAINKTITATGASGSLALEFGQGSTNGAGSNYFIAADAKVNLQAGQNFSTKQGSAGTTRNFTVINALGAQGSISTNDLQGIAGNTLGNYALGADIDASATSGWNLGEGFAPISNFIGQLDGLGHKITNLSINRPNTTNGVGLFRNLNTGAAVQHLGLTNVSITGQGNAGGIAGTGNAALIRNSYTTGSISCVKNGIFCGGILGSQAGTSVQSVYSNATVNASDTAGGLIGIMTAGTISDSYATGNINTVGGATGGLIGEMSGGTVNRSFATGRVTSDDPSVDGGLVGLYNSGTFTASFWDTQTSMTSNGVGPGGSNPGSGFTGRTTADMQKISTFQSEGWNIAGKDGTYPTLTFRSDSVWKMGPDITKVFIRLACGTMCFNTYGNELPTFVFDYFAAANSTTPLTTANLSNTTPTFEVRDATDKVVNFNSLSDAGTYKFLYTGGLTATGFELVAGDAVTWTVNKRTLTVDLIGTGANPLTKTYDGTTSLALSTQNFLLGNFVDTQGNGATITQTSGMFNSKDVVTASRVTAMFITSNLSVTGNTKASNYQLPAGAVAAGTITPKALTITGSTVADKAYNGDRAATITAGALTGLVTVAGITEKLGTTTATGLFDSKDVVRGTNGEVTSQDVAVTYKLVNGPDSTKEVACMPRCGPGGNGSGGLTQNITVPGDLASNYNLAGETLQGTITPKSLAVTGLTAENKVYDGKLTTSVTGTAVVDTAGVVGQDVVSVTGTVNGGLFTTKDVGTQKDVAISGLMLTGAQAGNYMLSSAALKADITAKALTVTGLAAATKAYDGNRTATVSSANAVFNGIIQGDMLSVTANGLFDTQDAGTNKTVEFSALALSGKDANNYALNASSASAKADITPKVLTVTATVADKTYNGNLGATVTVGELSGFVGSERLGTTTATGTFADKDVARDANGEVIAKNVTVAYTLSDGAPTTTGGSIGLPNIACMAPMTTCVTHTPTSSPITTPGAKASNYTLASETKTAKITPKALTISDSKVTDKQYDGTQAATVTAGTLTGFVTVDGVTEALGSTTAVGTFASQNASPEAQNVTAVYTLVNGSNAAHKAGNYSLANQTLTGKITPRALSITGSAVTTKTYDGNKTATVTAGTLGNLVGDETLGTTTAIGEFADPNAGSNKEVAVTYTLANGAVAKASNYTLAGEKLKGTINQKAVAVAGIAANGKTYDGNTTATLSNQGSVATGITGETLLVTTTGSFDKKDAGDRKVNTTTTIANGENGLASNYTLSNATNAVDATIDRKDLLIAATAIDKVYDGKSTATATLSTSDIETNDKVTLNQTAANFINANQENDKNVGQNKTVRVTGLSLTGDDAANYQLTNGENTAETTASITAKSLTIAATATNKVYNANTVADVTLSTADKVEGDTLTLNKTAANFDTKNVGTGKTVTVEGLSLGGTDADNYAISNANAKTTTTANITQAALSVSGITTASKTYDATTSATVSTANAKLNGLFEGDKLLVSATGSFADKKAETGKTVTLQSSYTGADVANYAITDQATTTADITQRSGVVVTADKQSKTVGSADPKLTFSVTGLLADDALNGSLTREMGEAAGLYDITQGTLSNDNYVISQFIPAQLTISQPIADVAIANAQTLEPKLDLPSERKAMEERSGDVAPFFIAANQARASGPAQLVVVNGGIKLPAGQEEK